jgi:hypothetical protein
MTDDSHPPAPAQRAVWYTEGDDWSTALHEFVVARFDLVQAAARFWLGTMTTLVALFSALIVINRGEALAELPVGTPVRALLFIGVVAVYGCAFGAVLLGAQASFGGLTLTRPDQHLSFLGDPGGWVHDQWSPEPMQDPHSLHWWEFRDLRRQRGDRARKYLHRSRALGIGALVVASVLALVVLALGGFGDDASAPTYVVVIHDGQITCGPMKSTSEGRVLVGGQGLDNVSQLTAVPAC